MADSFESMYRALLMWVPDLPPFLAQQFIRDRYRQAAERRPWSALRKEGEFLINTAKSTGTVAVTRNSTSVVGSGTAFASTDVGRQFQAGLRAPTYTITAVDVGAQTLTLDRVFGGDSNAAATYRIMDLYLTVPTDFQRFMHVLDPKMNWRIRHGMGQDELASWDPARTMAGTPWAIVDARFNSAGRPQYEVWPASLSERNYPYYYVARAGDLINDDDTPFYPLRGDILVKGALVDLCRWPGTPAKPNPMFSKAVELSRQFQQEWEDQLVEMERQDEDMYLTWLSNNPWSTWPLAPMDAAYMQSHAW